MFDYSVLTEQGTSVQVCTTKRRQEPIFNRLTNTAALSIGGVSKRNQYSLLANAASLDIAITEDRRRCGT